MKILTCTHCQQLILLDDYTPEWILKREWTCANFGTLKSGRTNLAQAVMGHTAEEGCFDHKDRNSHNNQKSNLRHATKQQNNFNRPGNKKATSKYKGVSYCSTTKKPWRAVIKHNDIFVHIGRYYDEDAAALAYNEKAQELFGEFAYINTITKKGTT